MLREVENELREVTEWYQLGLQLGVTPSKLREVERDYPQDNLRRKSEVLYWWLRNAPEASWEKLAQVLEAMGGYAAVAYRLRNKVPPKGRFSIWWGAALICKSYIILQSPILLLFVHRKPNCKYNSTS